MHFKLFLLEFVFIVVCISIGRQAFALLHQMNFKYDTYMMQNCKYIVSF
ncbi:MAG: hypothetical protein LBP59_09250 [Planctomycetaceae bacterium]|nr:hypothetical protein [Planctomycetaceae bacterium]